MNIEDEVGTVSFLGKQWIHKIEHLPNDIHSEIGYLLDVFFNFDIGKIAFFYINLKDIIIDVSLYDGLLSEIHNKFIENKPIIILKDKKDEEICSEWNNYSNTIIEQKYFESIIK